MLALWYCHASVTKTEMIFFKAVMILFTAKELQLVAADKD
jgi:hypothetical protein